MQLACSVCGTYVEIGGGREMRPSLPFVCKSCRAKAREAAEPSSPPELRADTPAPSPASTARAAPSPAARRSAPRPVARPTPAPAPSKPATPRPAPVALAGEGVTPAPVSVEPDVVSLRELEMILSPGVEPPPLDLEGPSKAPSGASLDRLDEPGHSVDPSAMAVRRQPPPLPRRQPSSPDLAGAPQPPPVRRQPSSPDLAGAPPPPPVRRQPSSPDLAGARRQPSSPDLAGARRQPSSPDLSGTPPPPAVRRQPSSPDLAGAPQPAAKQTSSPDPADAPMSAAPATLPQGSGAAGKAVAVDRSIFRVDSIPPPRISTKGDGGDDIPIDVDAPVDSGLSDLRSLAGPPTPGPQRRRGARAADDALVNLSGGLFGGNSALVTPLPSAALAPPVLGAMPPPPAKAPAREPAARPAPLPSAAASTPAIPDDPILPIEPGPGRRRLALGALVAVAAVAMIGAYMAASGPGAGGSGEAGDRTATAGSEGRLASGPPAQGSAAVREPSLDDEPPSSAPRPSAAASTVPAASVAVPSSPAAPSTVAAKEPPRGPGPERPAAPQPTTPSKPPPTATATAAPPPPPSGGGDFNKAAAIAALNAAAASAAMSCKGDTTGGGKVSVTFAPSGRVTSARLDSGPFVGTPTGGCIARAFRGASVPPFDGGPVTVSKQVNIR